MCLVVVVVDGRSGVVVSVRLEECVLFVVAIGCSSGLIPAIIGRRLMLMLKALRLVVVGEHGLFVVVEVEVGEVAKVKVVVHGRGHCVLWAKSGLS